MKFNVGGERKEIFMIYNNFYECFYVFMAVNKFFNEIVDSNNTPNFVVRYKRC